MYGSSHGDSSLVGHYGEGDRTGAAGRGESVAAVARHRWDQNQRSRKSSASAIELRAALCHSSLRVMIMKPFLIALSASQSQHRPSRLQHRMPTAIHLVFSNTPRSLTLAIQPSKHSHQPQKAL